MLYIFLVALTAAAAGGAVTAGREALIRYKAKQRGLAFLQSLLCLVVLFAPLSAIQFVSRNRLDFSYRESWVILFILLISAANLPFLTTNMRDLWKSRSETVKRPFVAFASAYAVLWQLLIFSMSVTGYALHAYPRLAPVFGGGRPSPVTMFVSPSAAPLLRDSGIKTADSGRTQSLLLVFEDSANYYVETQANAGSTIRVRKDLVAAVSHPVPSR